MPTYLMYVKRLMFDGRPAENLDPVSTAAVFGGLQEEFCCDAPLHCTRDGATCHQLFPHSGGMSPPRGNFSIFVTVGYSNLPPIMPGLMHHEGSGKAKLFKNMRMSVWKGESSAYNAHVLVICCPVCISEKQNTRQIPGSQ